MKKSKFVIALVALSLLVPVASASANTISENAKNKVVIVKLHGNLSLVLRSTYWQLSSLRGKSIQQVGDAVSVPIMPSPTAPENCRVMGSGCGKVTWKFKAIKLGVTSVVLTRSSCGEAMRCVGDQGTFRVKVLVIQ